MRIGERLVRRARLRPWRILSALSIARLRNHATSNPSTSQTGKQTNRPGAVAVHQTRFILNIVGIKHTNFPTERFVAAVDRCIIIAVALKRANGQPTKRFCLFVVIRVASFVRNYIVPASNTKLFGSFRPNIQTRNRFNAQTMTKQG
jgi:hypothetical protein